MELSEYIRPELMVLIPVLYILGMALKRAQWVADRLIPLLLSGAGIVLAAAYLLLNPDGMNAGQCILAGALQGILCAGMSVYSNQLYKQSGKDDDTQDKGAA